MNYIALLAVGLLLGPSEIGSEHVFITKFEVPPHVEIGRSAKLTCEHDLQKERLYSLKWFHDDQEFYRYEPGLDNPKWLPTKQSTGLLVNLSESSETKVVLSQVNLTATGDYECVVITEVPDFTEARRRANMTVVVIPSSKPAIEPSPRDSLGLGSQVDLTCIAAPSIPAATLEWYINGRKAPEKYLKRLEPERQNDGLFVSRLGLKFVLRREHYMGNELKLQCTARIATLYAKSDEHKQKHPTLKGIEERPAQPAIGGSASGSTSVTLLCTSWTTLVILGLTLR